MKKENHIRAIEFCSANKIDPSFIISIFESGLIEAERSGDEIYFPSGQLPVVEKIMMLYYDLDINLEGIETIMYLLKRSEQMQNEIILLRNRLRLYEESYSIND